MLESFRKAKLPKAPMEKLRSLEDLISDEIRTAINSTPAGKSPGPD